ncbi:hypothetical protein M9H77_25400 [Catharanthus roseus]|uniref:Uncharacterized protein n=1 Tax=Catharanthus roseus TaxID=4058 RepID=A0ACC0A6S2_CATRO|nr:hypothetical protein M9H77_25400 [Catharanthus roseus]
MQCNRSSRRNCTLTVEPVWILNLWMSAGEKPSYVIIYEMCLQPKCLYEHILHNVHPVICWPAVLLRTNRMSWNALNPPKLSDNPNEHIGFYTIKSMQSSHST